jgi:hypothetical protein
MAETKFLSLKNESPLSFNHRGFFDYKSPLEDFPVLFFGIGGSLTK